MTLYLSQLHLATWRGDVAADLDDCCRLHRRLMTAFPVVADNARATCGVLYRVEVAGRLLVQSQVVPDWSALPAGYARGAEVKPMTPTLTNGMTVRFRLHGNTRRSGYRDQQGRNHRVALLTPDAITAWFSEHLARAGLTIATLRVALSRPLTGQRHGQQILFTNARGDGAAHIRDATALLRAITDGVGAGKAYGCGLLSLAPYQEVD